jgi:hypothetical protein
VLELDRVQIGADRCKRILHLTEALALLMSLIPPRCQCSPHPSPRQADNFSSFLSSLLVETGAWGECGGGGEGNI